MIFPTKDAQENPLIPEFGLCHYRDFQVIHIQELPESAPSGQIPRGIDCVLTDELCDKVKPGDRVSIIGV